MKANYHTHTFRCNHATQDSDEAYVKAAIEAGYQILGFSDHTPWPYGFNYYEKKRNERMKLSELPEYRASILELKEKYRGLIEIKVGLECEYYPRYFGWLEEVSLGFDYLILGNHFSMFDRFETEYFAKQTDPAKIEEYTAYTLAGMGSGLFSYLAHPDLFLGDYPEFDATARTCSRMLCLQAKALDMPLEYNLYGVKKQEEGLQKGQGYPAEAFWRLAGAMGCKAIIGVDAHDPEDLKNIKRYENALSFLKDCGLSLVDHL